MSTLDLMEDGFPHGSREGYQQGCHSKGACIGPLDGLPTCVEANMRYSSDYGYRKRVDAGETPQQIAEADRAAAATSHLGLAKKKQYPGAGVEQSVEPIRTEVDVDDADDRTDEELADLAHTPEGAEVAIEQPPSSSPSSPSVEGKKPYMMTAHEVDRMVVLHREGLSDAAIADELGRSQPNISKKLRERGLAPNGKAAYAAPAAPAEPADAVEERAQEVRADSILAELADAKADVERLRVALDTSSADLAIEREANGPLKTRVALLEGQLAAENELRTTAEKRVATLTDQVATLGLELDVAKSPDALPSGGELATVPSSPVAHLEQDVTPTRPAAGMGLDIQPNATGGVSVRLHGGEPLQLSLQFDGGALRDVGVKIGA